MGYCGCGSISELRQGARFLRVTSAGLRESHVHDVIITKESSELPAGVEAHSAGRVHFRKTLEIIAARCVVRDI